MPANAAAPVVVAQHRIRLLAPPALALLILIFAAVVAGPVVRGVHACLDGGGSDPGSECLGARRGAPRPSAPLTPRWIGPRRRIVTARAHIARAWPWYTAACLPQVFSGCKVHPRNNCPAHVSRRAESGVTNSAYVYAAHAHVGYVDIDFSSSAIIPTHPPTQTMDHARAFLGEEKKMDTRGGWLGRRRVWECAGWVKRDGRGSGGGVCV